MTKNLNAVYEDGVLRLMEPLGLENGAPVRVRIETVEPNEALEALDALVDSCREMSDEQWRTFEEASARRPLFGDPGARDS